MPSVERAGGNQKQSCHAPHGGGGRRIIVDGAGIDGTRGQQSLGNSDRLNRLTATYSFIIVLRWRPIAFCHLLITGAHRSRPASARQSATPTISLPWVCSVGQQNRPLGPTLNRGQPRCRHGRRSARTAYGYFPAKNRLAVKHPGWRLSGSLEEFVAARVCCARCGFNVTGQGAWVRGSEGSRETSVPPARGTPLFGTARPNAAE